MVDTLQTVLFLWFYGREHILGMCQTNGGYDMSFSEKLYSLRRAKGLSQENLADMLNVSRQSVSKWEAGAAMPEIEKLVAIADIFSVSVDFLLREGTQPDAADAAAVSAQDGAVAEELREIRQLLRHHGPYEYTSKTRLLGLPLVHVKLSRFSGRTCVAKGIIAIGDVALGLVSVGGVSLGLFSLGGLSLGLVLAFGGLALGALALGGVCLGLAAVGGVAIGVYALGGVAAAREFAAGGVAIGRVAVGSVVRGEVTLVSEGLPFDQIYQFVIEHVKGIPDFLARLAAFIGQGASASNGN